MIRVLLVDDQEVVREGLRSLIDTDPELTVVGECTDGDEVVDRIERYRPDVVVMDIRMRPGAAERAERARAELEEELRLYELRLAEALSQVDVAGRLAQLDLAQCRARWRPTTLPTATGPYMQEAYEQIFTAIGLDVTFTIDELVVAGDDIAYVLTRSNGTQLNRATGEASAEANREIFIFHRIDGAWKIARYMFNKATENDSSPTPVSAEATGRHWAVDGRLARPDSRQHGE